MKLHQSLVFTSSNSEMLSGSTKGPLSSVFLKVLLYEHFLLYLGLFCALSLLPFLFICTCSQRCCSNETTGKLLFMVNMTIFSVYLEKLKEEAFSILKAEKRYPRCWKEQNYSISIYPLSPLPLTPANLYYSCSSYPSIFI